MWHTTKIFRGQLSPTFPPHVLYHANKTCPVADHDLFTSLFTLHTPFYYRADHCYNQNLSFETPIRTSPAASVMKG